MLYHNNKDIFQIPEKNIQSFKYMSNISFFISQDANKE